MKISPVRSAAGGAALALAVALTACAPGGSSSSSTAVNASASAAPTDIPSGKITLTVWDQNTNGGINDTQVALNKAFEAAHPNITIKRVVESFSNLKDTLRLALSGSNPPDVVQANQGYPDMGEFVKDGLLTPLDSYATKYGWNSYYPTSLLNFNKFTADGKTWQSGNLYGVSQTGEFVGIYYNKTLLAKAGISTPPTTVDELTADFAKAKAAGVKPLEYGDLQKDQGIHVYGVVQAALAGSSAVNNLVTLKSGAWTDAANVRAATTLQQWSKEGYIPAGANGLDEPTAATNFSKGSAAFFIDGTWDEATIAKGLGEKNVGVTTLTPSGSSTPVTEGGEGLAWAITSKTKNLAAAAAYVNYITGPDAMKMLQQNGSLPVVLPTSYTPDTSTLAGSVADQYKKLNASGTGIVPYLDYTTTTFFNTLTAAVQNLTAQRTTPDAFAQTLQKDYATFKSSRS